MGELATQNGTNNPIWLMDYMSSEYFSEIFIKIDVMTPVS